MHPAISCSGAMFRSLYYACMQPREQCKARVTERATVRTHTDETLRTPRVERLEACLARFIKVHYALMEICSSILLLLECKTRSKLVEQNERIMCGSGPKARVLDDTRRSYQKRPISHPRTDLPSSIGSPDYDPLST